jgi:hypothetical protein
MTCGVRCPRSVGQGPNREHGEDDPIGAKPVTAPATVSGEVKRIKPLGFPGRPRKTSDPRVRRPAGQNGQFRPHFRSHGG